LAHDVWFLEKGHLIESGEAASFFKKPQTARAQAFLDSLL
jgi:ABC-type polar amino acid transport system ATPase subunit